MLNPDGGLFFCENSEVVGNVLDGRSGGDLLPRGRARQHRDWIRDEKCPTCLSPCQMNVAAVKQVVPYVKFLVRAAARSASITIKPRSSLRGSHPGIRDGVRGFASDERPGFSIQPPGQLSGFGNPELSSKTSPGSLTPDP